MNKLFFSPQVAEQTIYFQKFTEQSFFHKKPYPPPPQESNGRPLIPIKLEGDPLTHSKVRSGIYLI